MTQPTAFDICQRLNLLKRFLEHLFRDASAGSPAWALDVGGYPGTLASEIGAGCRVATLDRELCGAKDYVRGDALALPFRPQTFDAIVASDMIEHVPGDKRAELLAGLCAASRGWLLINGPFRAPEVEQAEASVSQLARAAMGRPNPWLEEHWQCGLPDLRETRRLLETHGYATAVVPNGALFSWFFLKSLDMLFRALPDAAETFDQVNDLYLRLWSETDHRRPTYRYLILAHRDVDAIYGLIQSPPAKAGLEFFGPQTDVPPAGAEEAQRIRATGTLFERMAESLRARLEGAGGGVDAPYLNRLERIVQEQEQQHAWLQKEIAVLRANLNVYETSRLVRLWRKLRWG